MHSAHNPENIYTEKSSVFEFVVEAEAFDRDISPDYLECSDIIKQWFHYNIENCTKLSELVAQFYIDNGYHLTAKSFLYVLEYLKQEGFTHEILARDDIGFYDEKATRQTSWVDNYENAILKVQDSLPVTSISSASSSDSDASSENSDVAENSDSSDHSLAVKVIVAVCVGFVFISYWLIKKFQKKDDEVKEELKEETPSEEGVSSASIFEDYHGLTYLKILLIPPILILLWDFRFYFYYQIFGK